MKTNHHSTCIFILLTLIASMSLGHAQNLTLPKIDLVERAKGKTVFKFEENEALIAGPFLKRVSIGKDTAVVTYLNKSDSNQKPNFRFSVFNAYGMLLGTFSDIWLLDTISVGDTHTESHHFSPPKFDDTFRFSDISLPEDWAVPVYLMVE